MSVLIPVSSTLMILRPMLAAALARPAMATEGARRAVVDEFAVIADGQGKYS